MVLCKAHANSTWIFNGFAIPFLQSKNCMFTSSPHTVSIWRTTVPLTIAYSNSLRHYSLLRPQPHQWMFQRCLNIAVV